MSLAGIIPAGGYIPQRLSRAARLALVAFLLGLLTFAVVSGLTANKPRVECGGFAIGVSPIGGCDEIGKKVRTLIPGVPSPVIEDWR